MGTRRWSVAAVVLAGIAVGILGAVASMGSGQTNDGTAAVLAAESSPSPTEREVPPEAPAPQATELSALPITTYEVFLARDPFEPVVPVAAPAPTASPTVAPTVAPTTSPTTSPSPSPSPGETLPPTNGSSGCTQGATVVCDGHTVKAVDIFSDDAGPGAVIQVDGALYEVRSGDQFATHFLVRSIETGTVTLQYGEDVFTLFEGEAVLK